MTIDEWAALNASRIARLHIENLRQARILFSELRSYSDYDVGRTFGIEPYATKHRKQIDKARYDEAWRTRRDAKRAIHINQHTNGTGKQSIPARDILHTTGDHV